VPGWRTGGTAPRGAAGSGGEILGMAGAGVTGCGCGRGMGGTAGRVGCGMGGSARLAPGGAVYEGMTGRSGGVAGRAGRMPSWAVAGAARAAAHSARARKAGMPRRRLGARYSDKFRS